MNQGTRSITDFAAAHGLQRQTIGDVLKIQKLPTEKMQHGMAKGLSVETQNRILRILGLSDQRPTSAA